MQKVTKYKTMSEVKSWNKDNNLAFKKTKTNVSLFSGSGLPNQHHLDKNELTGNFSSDNEFEIVKCKKLLEVNILNLKNILGPL